MTGTPKVERSSEKMEIVLLRIHTDLRTGTITNLNNTSIDREHSAVRWIIYIQMIECSYLATKKICHYFDCGCDRVSIHCCSVDADADSRNSNCLCLCPCLGEDRRSSSIVDTWHASWNQLSLFLFLFLFNSLFTSLLSAYQTAFASNHNYLSTSPLLFSSNVRSKLQFN